MLRVGQYMGYPLLECRSFFRWYGISKGVTIENPWWSEYDDKGSPVIAKVQNPCNSLNVATNNLVFHLQELSGLVCCISTIHTPLID